VRQLVRFPSPPKQRRRLSLFDMSGSYRAEPGKAFLGEEKLKNSFCPFNLLTTFTHFELEVFRNW